MKKHLILMADVLNSSDKDQKKLMRAFKTTVKHANEKQANALLSPLTITLGDEFQGVVKSLPDVITLVLQIEELIVRQGGDFKLRYVIEEGIIDTPINKEIAYGMLGEGLTMARSRLQQLKKNGNRFLFNINDEAKSTALNNVFLNLESIIDDWNQKKDYDLVESFLDHDDYKDVAAKLKKDRSLIWKRKRSLKINEYQALKQVAHYLGGLKHA